MEPATEYQNPDEQPALTLSEADARLLDAMCGRL